MSARNGDPLSAALFPTGTDRGLSIPIKYSIIINVLAGPGKKGGRAGAGKKRERKDRGRQKRGAEPGRKGKGLRGGKKPGHDKSRPGPAAGTPCQDPEKAGQRRAPRPAGAA